MRDLKDLTLDDLLVVAESLGEKPYRALQIYSWVYRMGAVDIDSMTDLSKALRERLKLDFAVMPVEVVDTIEAADGTKKFLTRLSDGEVIESVLIPEGARLTLCVSSQAGCAYGCGFCSTAAGGFERDLALAELTGQMLEARRIAAMDGRTVTNVVLMGMGEPLANYDTVLKFIRIVTDPRAFNISHNRVTVSTCGLVPGIDALSSDAKVNLAVSLNATTDEVRGRIMPVNKKYPIAALLDAVRRYQKAVSKTVTMEYVLIAGLNDSAEDARRLVRLLKGIDAKVNLIPFNPFPGAPYERPTEKAVDAFWKLVLDAGLTVIKRASKGAEIQAACGQLRLKHAGRG